jgi:UDPglucose 6-dehydrogenase
MGEVARAIGLDDHIETRFLQAGLGWGGGRASERYCCARGLRPRIGHLRRNRVIRERNSYAQRERVVEKLLRELKILKGTTISLLGLAFKPNTDALRDAPALDIAARLLRCGAKVRVHDAVALGKARRECSESGIRSL